VTASEVTQVTVDAAVVGGGPAGAATALCLARSGLSVALVEPADRGDLRVGETLPPRVRELLAQLGVWERFAAAGHCPAYAIRSAWGSAEPADQDHVFDPHGCGWHVDRRAFDRMLADAAVEGGVRLVRGVVTAVTAVARKGGAWTVEVNGTRLRSDHLVDATGRGARVARRLGARLVTLDRLVGVVASLPPERTTAALEGATLIEAVADGWWYSARTPDGHMLLAYMTDGDLWARTARRDESFAAGLARAPLTRERVAGGPGVPVRVVAAASVRLDPASGPGWLAVGDAAMAVDPLSGQGVCLALRSGLSAAETILGERAGDAKASDEYAASVARAFEAYTATRRWFYGCERRFPSSEFWRRRHLSPIGIEPFRDGPFP
jgi:flavin-dependent dehydrogenase